MSKIDHPRWWERAHHKRMLKRKANKEVRRAAVAQISREMAQPRQPASVRKQLEKGNEKNPTSRT